MARQEDDYGRWQERVQPSRVERDPQILENFLKSQCQPILDDLLAWINRPPVRHPPIMQPPSEADFEKLRLPKREQGVARDIYDELKTGGKGWTHFRRAFDKPLDDSVIRRVRNEMRDMGFIRTSQGGGLYIRHTEEQ